MTCPPDLPAFGSIIAPNYAMQRTLGNLVVTERDLPSTSDRTRDEPTFSHFKAALLSGPTIGITGSFGPLIREYASVSAAVPCVVLLTLLAFAMYQGARTMIELKTGTFATWSVRIGRYVAWTLLALSPLALAMPTLFSSTSPILQYVWIVLAIAVCAVYLEMVHDYFRRPQVA